MTVARALIALVALVLVAGCGGDDDASTDTTTTAPSETTTVRVYWLRDGKVWPAMREVEETDDLLNAALDELRAGPDPSRSRASSTSPRLFPQSQETELPRAGLAQLVYTLTQFPDPDSAEIDGVNYTRADFEEQTPSVLVESPLSFEEVTSPITATGTANTFEATFHYELTDTDGLIVDDNFVTATSGTGTRGTFEFTTDDFTVPFDGVGSLIVFERSAEDGSKIHIVEIPPDVPVAGAAA